MCLSQAVDEYKILIILSMSEEENLGYNEGMWSKKMLTNLETRFEK